MKAILSAAGTTPIFIIKGNSVDLSRIYASVYLKEHKAWMYPAYPPFLQFVLNDFATLGVELDTKVQEYLQTLPSLEELLQRVKDAPVYGTYKPYQHQYDGIAEMLHYPRWILRWDMGTGKTKVAVTALVHLKKKALVLTPKIALDNWANEIQIHSDNILKSHILTGATKNKKIDSIVKAVHGDADVIITTYDTARLYGIPIISKYAHKLFKSTHIPMATQIQSLFKGLEDSASDTLFQAWKKMAKPSELKALAANLKPDIPFITDIPYDVIILDESHRIRNISSNRTKIVSELGKRVHHRYLLTGTISTGNPLHLYPQLSFIARYLCPESYWDFKKKFCVFSKYNDRIITGYKDLHVLSSRVNLVSSERKIEDCVDLPELRDIDITFDLTDEQIRNYNQLVKNLGLDFGDHGTIRQLNGGVLLNKLLQVCSGYLYVKDDNAAQVCDDCPHLIPCIEGSIQPGTKRCKRYEELKGLIKVNTLRFPENPKLNALEDLLEDLLNDPQEKVVIWANTDAEMEDIGKLLTKNEYQYVQVDGSTTHKIKELEKTFQTDPNCRVYLGQQSTGIAINLVAARYAVYYSRAWNLEYWLQSRAREYRIGQTRKTIIYRLVANKSIEKQQLIALDTRQDIALMLTERVDCLFCDSFEKCTKEGITAWSEKCMYKTKMTKTIVRPKEIKLW